MSLQLNRRRFLPFLSLPFFPFKGGFTPRTKVTHVQLYPDSNTFIPENWAAESLKVLEEHMVMAYEASKT